MAAKSSSSTKTKNRTTKTDTSHSLVIKHVIPKKPASRKPRRRAAATKTTSRKTTKKKSARKNTPPRKDLGKSTAKATTEKDLFGVRPEPLAHLMIEQYLRESGFRGGISTDKHYLDRYATDESIFSIRPQVVLQPKTQRDVEIAVNVIAKHTEEFPSLSLTPRAAGTGLSGGSLSDSVVIDMCAHLDKIEGVEKHGETITITCEAGAMWRDVEKKLRKHHAYIPSYPSSKDICSIGGAVGNNSAGPDSLRFGHTANFVTSLEVVLRDGNTYTIRPLTYKEFRTLLRKKHAYAQIAREIYTLIEENEIEILASRPKSRKNTAGYPLWDVINGTVDEFKRGHATFDLTKLLCGSQGTIGVITSVTLRAEPIADDTELIVVPIFNLISAGEIVVEALKYSPINVEFFDGLTYDLALKHPQFFKHRLEPSTYYQVLLSMYTNYHIRYRRNLPDFTLLITVDKATADRGGLHTILENLKSAGGDMARVVRSPAEKEMLWQLRRASYSLSKFQDARKRPAAFLEDMTVPPEHLARFFMDIKQLLRKYSVTAAVHGHGGNGHFHFYPLLDFTRETTPLLIEKMAEEFYNLAISYGGSICGEHNDGIIRTPHLSKMFTQRQLEFFNHVEHIFDPVDIFNPGKKVNPRFDVKESIRKRN